MKKTLFLVLAGTTFALCNCQQQTTPATTEAPVAPAPIKVVADKNEITPVTVGGGLAPESMTSGYIIEMWGNGSEPFDYIDFNTINVGKNRYPDNIFPSATMTYTKTGAKTAQLRGSNGETYNLIFTTSSKGKVMGLKNEGVNVTFEITHI